MFVAPEPEDEGAAEEEEEVEEVEEVVAGVLEVGVVLVVAGVVAAGVLVVAAGVLVADVLVVGVLVLDSAGVLFVSAAVVASLDEVV